MFIKQTNKKNKASGLLDEVHISFFFSHLPEEYSPKQAKDGAVVTLCIQPSLKIIETGTPYFAENDFWRQVLRRSAQRPGPALYSFGKTKVCHLEGAHAANTSTALS